MCSNYIPARPAWLEQHFGVSAPAAATKPEAYPGYLAPIIRLAHGGEHAPQAKADSQLECVPAMFGIVPAWADIKLARSTYNARTETVAIKPSFRQAWKKGQFCIVPAEAIFEPSYETGKAVRWRIAHADGTPLAVAGIWESRANGVAGEAPLLSFSMLTINADDHPLMRRFHRPTDEKRMLVFLPPHEYENWLHADSEEARSFLTPYPSEQLFAEPAPNRAAARPVANAVKPGPPSLFD